MIISDKRARSSKQLLCQNIDYSYISIWIYDIQVKNGDKNNVKSSERLTFDSGRTRRKAINERCKVQRKSKY